MNPAANRINILLSTRCQASCFLFVWLNISCKATVRLCTHRSKHTTEMQLTKSFHPHCKRPDYRTVHSLKLKPKENGVYRFFRHFQGVGRVKIGVCVNGQGGGLTEGRDIIFPSILRIFCYLQSQNYRSLPFILLMGV